MNLRDSQAALIKVLQAEVAASRAYFREMDPKPAPEKLFRAWIDAMADSNTATAEHRAVVDGLVQS